MLDIIDFSEKDAGAMYEWLKNVIISSRYITPGVDTFLEIRIKTIAMLRKMLGRDGICGEDIAETAKRRECAVHGSAIFVNIAGELICQWVGRDDDEAIYTSQIGKWTILSKSLMKGLSELARTMAKTTTSIVLSVLFPVQSLSIASNRSRKTRLRSLRLTARISRSVLNTCLRKIALIVCIATLDSSS